MPGCGALTYRRVTPPPPYPTVLHMAHIKAADTAQSPFYLEQTGRSAVALSPMEPSF